MYSDDRYSAYIQREHNKPFTMSTRDADLLLAIKKGHLTQEEAADLLIVKTPMPRKHLFTHGDDDDDDDDDDEHGAAGGHDYYDVVLDNDDDDTYEYFDSNDLLKDDDDEDKEMQLIHKKYTN